MRLLRVLWLRLVEGRRLDDIETIAALSAKVNTLTERAEEMRWELKSLRRETERIREDKDTAQRRADTAYMTMANVAYSTQYGWFPFKDAPHPPQVKPVSSGPLEEAQRVEDVYAEERRIADEQLREWTVAMIGGLQ